MFRMTTLKALVLLSAALVVTIAVDRGRLASERRWRAIAALAATNIAAARDSTRDLAAANREVAALLGDSLRSVEQQVVQRAQRADALDRALGRERRARYTLDVTVDSLKRISAAVVAPDTSHGSRDVRRARFDVRQPPYTISAVVDVPPPPDSAHLGLHVAVDPIPLSARLSCSAPNDQGIRTAVVVASAPPWATVHFAELEQSPDLCASPALGRSQVRHAIEIRRLMIGAGRTFPVAGAGGWGLFVGSGISWL